MKPETKELWMRRKYLIPNALTLGNMFCGFLTIIYASSGRFEKACIAIAVALLLDGLDGRVARSLKATSKFGVEFDSFSDLISFGVAPAFLIYNWCFRPVADEFGVIVCFIFMLCAAGRLARFNISSPANGNFEGLPTPGAAGMVVALVNLVPRITPSFTWVVISSLLMLSLSYLMVSKFEFFKLKRLKIEGMHPWHVIFLGTAIALVWYDSGKGFLVLALAYALSGPFNELLKRRKEGTLFNNKALQDKPETRIIN